MISERPAAAAVPFPVIVVGHSGYSFVPCSLLRRVHASATAEYESGSGFTTHPVVLIALWMTRGMIA